MKKRLHFIDIAKAFAIIIIVFGHAIVHSEHCTMLFRILYSFNVPLFFLLSGFTFKTSEGTTIKYIFKKFTRIMIPYFVWAFVFLLIYNFLGSGVADSLNIESEPTLLKILIGNGANNALKQNTPLWFLPALFSIEIINNFLLLFLKKKKEYFTYIYFALSIIIGFLLYKYLNYSLIWGLNSFLYINCFFVFGIIIGKKNIFSKKEIGIPIIIMSIIGLIAGIYNETVSWVDYSYNNYFLMLLSGFSLSMLVIYISYLIKENKVLEYIGRNTMGILIFHKLIILIFQTKAGIISKYMLSSTLCIELILSLIATIISVVASLVIAYVIGLFLPILIGNSKKEVKYVK